MSGFRRVGLLGLVLGSWLTAACTTDVQVGAVISESGAVATYGVEVKRGLDLAVEQVNAAGGIRGGQITLLYRDDATMPDIGAQVVEALIEEDGVNMIIGAVSSPVTIRIAKICEEKGVVLLSPSSSAPEISELGDYIFRNYPSDVLEGTAMASFARDQGFERVVIFALDNVFGRGLTEVFTKEYESKYRKVVKTFTFAEGQREGFEEMVAEAAKENPDGIYIISYDAELPALLDAIHGSKIEAVRMGTASVRPDVARTAGEAAEKLVYPQPGFDLESNDPAVARFVTAYREKYSKDPDIFAAHGYDALMLLVEGLEAAGSTHPDNVKLGLSSVKGYQGAAGITTFDKNGDVVRYPRLFVIQQGKATPYEKFVEDGHSLFGG